MNSNEMIEIDLPSLQSIENERGGSFIEIHSVIMESIEFEYNK